MDEQMQQQIVLLVQMAMQGDQQANQLIEQIMQAAQQGDQLAAQIALLIQQVAQQMLQTQSAKFGAKLNYIKFLRGKCPDGFEMQSFKKGGAVCKKCVKKVEKGGNTFTRKRVDEYNYVDTKTDDRRKQRHTSEDGRLYVGANGKTGMEGSVIGDSIRNADKWDRAKESKINTPRKFRK